MRSLLVICIVLFTMTIAYLSASSSNHLNHINPASGQPAQAAEFLKFDIPAVTHGLAKTQSLPDGDLFLLPKPMTMAVAGQTEGVRVFPVNIENFGGDGESIGALPGVTPQGLSLSKSNTKVRATTCSESLWDGNMLIASTGASGDRVRLFLEYPDGAAGPELATFTVKGAGVEVSTLHQDLMLYVNNRYATGPMWKQGTYIPFAVSAGAEGYRTDLLTLSWPMHSFSPLQGCFRVGVEIERGDTQGATSVVVTDFVVNRNRVQGDENNGGFGLLGRLTGGYPSGFPCKAECPFPTDQIPEPPVPNPQTGDGGDDCNAICYRSPIYFRLNINSLPHGTVIIGGVNYNRPVSTTNKRAMLMALRGGWTPLQQLNAEFVAAQLNLLNAGGDGSPRVFYALEGKLKCYGLEFEPITMSNGFTITPDTQLKDLYHHCRECINLNHVVDMPALSRVLDMLNGNNPLNVCNNMW